MAGIFSGIPHWLSFSTIFGVLGGVTCLPSVTAWKPMSFLPGARMKLPISPG